MGPPNRFVRYQHVLTPVSVLSSDDFAGRANVGRPLEGRGLHPRREPRGVHFAQAAGDDGLSFTRALDLNGDGWVGRPPRGGGAGEGVDRLDTPLRKNFGGSFSAASKPIFASKDSLESS